MLFAKTAEELQKMIDILNKIVMEFGQKISMTKTKVMKAGGSQKVASNSGEGLVVEVEGSYEDEKVEEEAGDIEMNSQSGIREEVKEEEVVILEREEEFLVVPEEFYINGEKLEQVKKFKYLGTIEMENSRLDEEISVRTQRMEMAYNKYDKSFFRRHKDLRIKIRIFNMVIVTNGLYGCQAWNVA